MSDQTIVAEQPAPAYPGGTVRPIPMSSVDSDTLSKLRISAIKQPWSNGAGVLQAPLPAVFVCVRDEAYARRLAKNAGHVLAWNWNLSFGSVLSFTLFGKKSSGVSAPAFVPFEREWVDRIVADGRFHLVLGTDKYFLQAFVIEIPAGELGQKSREGYAHIATFPDEAILHHWPAAVFGLLNYRSEKGAMADLVTPADRVQMSWADDLRVHLREIHRLAKDEAFQIRQEFLEGEAQHFAPIASDILSRFKAGRHDPTTLADETLAAIHGYAIAKNIGQSPVAVLFTDMSFLFFKLSLIGPETTLLRHWLTLAALTSPEAANGRNATWLDATNSERGLVHLKKTELDLAWIGARAPNFHLRRSEALDTINTGFFLGERDIPIALDELHAELLALAPDHDAVSANEMIDNLLAEVSACRKWSIPWGATIELRAGTFEFAKVYEVAREFFLKLTNSRGEYALVCVDPDKKTWNTPYRMVADEQSADLALRILVAAVLRDFVVVEDRETVFGARLSSDGSRQELRDGPRVIYLPRIRYISKPNIEKAESELSLRTRAPHLVSPHLRKAAECSELQRRLAAAYGFTVPPGYTFVRKHTRGRQEGGAEAPPAIYRSRSALNAMYESIEGRLGGVAEWFKFEKDVLRLMKRLGFQVEHVGAHRHDDRGVDVYALSHDEQEGWAIQCKCWRADRHVGPDVVRELIGAVAAYPAGTKGMLVTTSSFTAGADQLARENAIMLIDGAEFMNLLVDRASAAH